DQNACLAVERLEDLDPLLLPDRELPDPCPRVDVEAVALAQLGNPPLDGARVQDEGPSPSVVAEDDVLGDGERLHEAEVLMDHADAGVDRIPGRVEVDGIAVE